MNFKIIVFTLASLFASQAIGMHDMDQAMGTLDVEWVEDILEKNECTVTQKEEFSAAIRSIIQECQKTTRSLISSKRDALRFLFGLGTNGCGFSIMMAGIVGLALDKHTLFQKYALGALGAGSLAWIYGLYNVVKGWNMTSAYTKLSKARQIQKIIYDIQPIDKKNS